MSQKNTIPQNTTARRFSRNVPQQAPTGTRRAVKSTPAKEVANITAQRARDTVQNNPPPFSQLPATREEAPSSKTASTETVASAPTHVERHTIGDWLELQVEGDSAQGPCELVGITLSNDSPQLATPQGRERARAAFDAWMDAHLRNADGLAWSELVQVMGMAERELGWATTTPQWLRLQTLEARRSKDIGPLLLLLDSPVREPLGAESLHKVFELCRTVDLPDEARIALIERLLPLLPALGVDPAIHDECLCAIQRLDDRTTRQRLIAEHARLHPPTAGLHMSRALNGPWRKHCQDLVAALAQQWTRVPGSASRILATVRSLASSPDGNDANTVERQFLLLRDLLFSIDPGQRAACLAQLQDACEDAIQDARMPAKGTWSTATPPTLTGLRSALRALSVIHAEANPPERGAPGARAEALLTEWMLSLHTESAGDPEAAHQLWRRIRFAHHTDMVSALGGQDAPLNPLFNGLFALHGLPA